MSQPQKRLLITLLLIAGSGLAGAIATYTHVHQQQNAIPSPSLSTSPSPTPSPSAPQPSKAPFDQTTYSLTDPASLWMVVNKQHGLPTSYIPVGLKTPAVRLQLSSTVDQMHLRGDAADALTQLLAAADKAGLPMALTSGYRSASYQAQLYDRNVKQYGVAATNAGIAKAGHSEHQTGLAADISRADGQCTIDACFGNTPQGLWLAAHATEYGFIIRYPKGKEAITGYEYEPWHLRYVGPLLAQHLQATGQTLDEFAGTDNQ